MKKISKKISAVTTKIVEKRQMIDLHLEDSSVAEIPFIVIPRLFPSISITLVEALVGMSFCEFTFERGDNLLNEKNLKNNPSKKKWSIEYNVEILFENYLSDNIKLFRHFQRITKTKLLPNSDKHKASIQLFGEKQISFIPVFLFPSISSLLPNECHLLEGSFITTETWNAGEYVHNDGQATMLIRKSGLILRNPIIRTDSDFLVSYNKYQLSKIKPNPSYPPHPSRGSLHSLEKQEFKKFKNAPDDYGGYLSDDFIDDVLGGEPDAIWNII